MIGKTNDKKLNFKFFEDMVKKEVAHIKDNWYIFLMCFFIARQNIIDEIFPFAIVILCVYCYVMGNSIVMLLVTIGAVMSVGFNFEYTIMLIAVFAYFFTYRSEKKSILYVAVYASLVLLVSKTTILVADGFSINNLMLNIFEAMFVFSAIIITNDVIKSLKYIKKEGKLNIHWFKDDKHKDKERNKANKEDKKEINNKSKSLKASLEAASTVREEKEYKNKTQNNKIKNIYDYKKSQHLNIFSDAAKSKIKEQLLWQNIQIKFFEIISSDKNSIILSITVKSEKLPDDVEGTIELTVRNISGVKLKCTERVVASPNYYVFKFKNIKRIRIRTYNATAIKEGSQISGDSFAYAGRADRYYTVLCDGLGSGEEAYNESNAAVELLSKFLYTDFTEEQILKTLNTVLMLKLGDERYVTFDFNIIDYGSRQIRLYKAGAAPTYIISGNNVEKISAKSLPMGILDNFDYSSFKKKVDMGDIIIMVSDGIIDSIGLDDKKSLDKFIETVKNKDPQTIANSILSYALRGQDTIMDDMTVLVTKIQ